MSEVNTNTQTEEELNDVVEEVVDDAEVMTVPIDDTLTVSGEAADAKAVGDALALKADKSEIQTSIKVNGQTADNQGLIIVTAVDIPVSPTDPMTVAEALEGDARTAEVIKWQSGSDETIKEHVDALGNGTVRSVYGVEPDENGDVSPAMVPYADNLYSDNTQQVNESFLIRATAGSVSISDGSAWLNKVMGNRVHNGYVAESIEMTVTPAERTAPAAITATIDEATFEAYVDNTPGTYSIEYGESGWDHTPTDYGLTISNTPVIGDEIVIVWDGENDATVTVNAAERPVPAAITATINRNVFVAYVQASGTITLTYTTGWSADPTLYGISVTNAPISGDVITVVYVKEERGQIVQANPTGVRATGWNLYNHTNGYARVVKYSDTYGYKVGGTRMGLTFAETLEGQQTVITPDANGLFTVSSDGYVFVIGGNNTDTYILTTWSDWTGGPAGGFKKYAESGVSLAAIMAANFPYGLCRVGTVRDEINFTTKQAISRIMRMAYNETNLAAAKASGRAYEYDENYIYIVRDAETVNSFTGENEYTENEHGTEYIAGSAVEVYTEILYGLNLKDKLRRDVVTYAMTVNELKGM